MGAELPLERLEVAIAIALLVLGALTAWASSNVVKRLVSLLLAQLGALIGLAALDAPPAALIAAIALSLAQLLLGAALLVRLQEGYGGVEAPEFDAADEQSEPTESGG